MTKSNTPLVDLIRAKRKATSTFGLSGITTLVGAAVTAASGAAVTAANALVTANIATTSVNTTNTNFLGLSTLISTVFSVANAAISSAANALLLANIANTAVSTQSVTGTANTFIFYLTSNIQSGGYLPVFGANSNIFLNAGKYEIEALVNFKKLTNDGYVQFALKSDGTAEVVGQLIGENSNNVGTGFRSTGITSYWPATRVLTTSGTDTYTCTLKALFKTNSGNVYLFPVLSNGSMSTESGSYLKITQLPDNTSSKFRI